MIEQLEATLKEQESALANVNDEIKKQTESLQKQANALETRIAATKKKILSEATSLYNNNHILDRFNAWVKYSTKGHSDWIISDGPLRDYMDSGCSQRYQTLDVLDTITDLMYNIKTIEQFDAYTSQWGPKNSEELTALLEDVIEQDVETFVWDW